MMNNLFFDEKSYRTNFFLEFKSSKTEARFRRNQHAHSVHGLIAYLICSIIIVTAQFMDSTCFRYTIDCKLEWFSILSLLSALAALVLIHFRQNLHIIRVLLMIISLYLHLNILDRFEYTAGLVLIVLQTTISTLLVFDCWKYHVIYNTLAYFALHWGVTYWNMKQLYTKDVNTIAQDFAIFHLLSTICVALLERNSREKWAMLDSTQRTEKIFQRLFENTPQPIILLDSNKSILLCNRKGLEVISQIDRRLIISDLAHTNSPSLGIFQKINFISLVNNDYQDLVNAAIDSLNADSKASVRIAFRKPHELAKAYKYDEDEGHLPTEDSLSNTFENKSWGECGPFYDLELSEFIWSGKRSVLVTLQATNLHLKNHDVLVKRLNKAINDLENTILNLEKYYMALPSQFKKKLGVDTLPHPLAKAIMDLNNLKTYILNTHSLNSYLTGFGRQQFAQAEFNIKQFTIYIIEMLTPQALENKVQINLSFGNGFPEYVSSDPSLFQQIFSNIIRNIMNYSNDTAIDITCGVRNIISGGVLLLEFKIEAEKSDSISKKPIKEALNCLFNESGENLCAKVLSITNFWLELGIIPAVLRDTEGGVEVVENNNADGGKVIVTLVVPMLHYLPEDSHAMERVSESISRTKLTNTRTVINQNKLVWKKEEAVEPAHTKVDDSLADTSGSCSSITSALQAHYQSEHPETRSLIDLHPVESSNPIKSEKHLTYAEFKEEKLKQELLKSPMLPKRTEITKVRGAREELKSLANLGFKQMLPRIQEHVHELEDSFTAIAPIQKFEDDDFEDLSFADLCRSPNIFKRDPPNLSRVNSSSSTAGPSYFLDYASPESFKIVSSFNTPTFDEQLVKTIIVFTLIELLSKQPPPPQTLRRKSSECDNPLSDDNEQEGEKAAIEISLFQRYFVSYFPREMNFLPVVNEAETREVSLQILDLQPKYLVIDTSLFNSLII